MKKGISLFLCGLLSASAVVASSSVTALAAPKVDPYNTVQAELNFGSEGVVKSPEVYQGQKITVLDSIDVGDYWYVKDVDFSNGLSKMSLTARAESPAIVEVRKDSVDGEALGSFKINSTNGEFKTFTAKMKNVEGSAVLYFVGKYGSCAADYWVAEAAEATVTPDPSTGPYVDPYKGVSAKLNFGNEGVEYVEEDGETVAVVGVGDYWRVKDVKFQTGTAVVGLKAKAGQASAIQLRKGAVDGELLGTFRVNKSDEYKDYYVNVSNFDLEGKTELYFVGVVGETTVKSWNALLKPGVNPVEPDPVEPDPIEPDPVVTTVNPYEVVEAEDATIMENLEVKTEDGRTYVDWFRPKATYAVENVEFDGSSKIAITYISDSAFVLEIHDGAKNGPRLAFLNIPNSDNEWKTITLDFPDLHGVYDLYFVPKFGVIDFDSWQILKDGQQVDPVDPDPVDPDPVDPDPVDPDPIDPDPIVEQGITTDYSINNWGSGYQVQVKVTNASSRKAENWVVKVNKNDVNIDSFWNVKVAEEGGYYVITPVEWNRTIDAGKSVEFGFQGAGSIGDKIELFAEGEVKEDPTPVDPDPVDPDPVDPDPVDPDPVDPDPVDPDPVDPDPVDPDPIVVNENLDLEYTINGQGSVTINFKVANNGKSAVNGWTLKLKKSQLTIDNSWCVKVASVGDYYVITPESWNSVVNAGDGAYFGVSASGVTGTTLDYTLE